MSKPDPYRITYNYTITNPQSWGAYSIQIPPVSNTANRVAEEMAVIEAVDRLVDAGLTHPAVETILNTLTTQKGS